MISTVQMGQADYIYGPPSIHSYGLKRHILNDRLLQDSDGHQPP